MKIRFGAEWRDIAQYQKVSVGGIFDPYPLKPSMNMSLDQEQRFYRVFPKQPLSIHSGDAAHRLGATRSPEQPCSAGVGPDVLRECLCQVHNEFCRNDIIQGKWSKSVSGGLYSVRSRDQDNPCVLNQSIYQHRDFAMDFGAL